MIVIVKKDGTATNKMAQEQAENYFLAPSKKFGPPMIAGNPSCLKQAFNDVTTPGRGKATGDYKFNNFRVLHASSGNGQKSVSVFYYDIGNIHYIIAVGEHVTSKSYKLSYYGQPTGPFKSGSTIVLS